MMTFNKKTHHFTGETRTMRSDNSQVKIIPPKYVGVIAYDGVWFYVHHDAAMVFLGCGWVPEGQHGVTLGLDAEGQRSYQFNDVAMAVFLAMCGAMVTVCVKMAPATKVIYDHKREVAYSYDGHMKERDLILLTF
jgi:hypothetical protein